MSAAPKARYILVAGPFQTRPILSPKRSSGRSKVPESKSVAFARLLILSLSRHFQGAFLRGEYPGLKPWAKPSRPFGAETLEMRAGGTN